MLDHAVPRALHDDAATEQEQSQIKLSFVTATNGGMGEVCVRVWVVILIDVGSRNKHIHNFKKGAVNWMGCAAGAGRRQIRTQTPSVFQK